jgi:hypothetical protein
MALKLHGARRIAVHTWEALKESKGSVVFTSGNSAEAPKSAYAAVSTINEQSLPGLVPSPSEASKMAYRSTASFQALS